MLGLSPHPGVSYLFQNQTPATAADESLWNVALGSTPFSGAAGPGGHPAVMSSPPPSWTPALGELVLKVDGKFKVCTFPSPLRLVKVLMWQLPGFGANVPVIFDRAQKIISVLLKDLDDFARNSIKDELASLDPLLRNVGGWSVPVGNGDEEDPR
jgi:hypothetical protein